MYIYVFLGQTKTKFGQDVFRHAQVCDWVFP